MSHEIEITIKVGNHSLRRVVPALDPVRLREALAQPGAFARALVIATEGVERIFETAAIERLEAIEAGLVRKSIRNADGTTTECVIEKVRPW